MLFLSKGMIITQSTEQELIVTRCGVDYILTGIGARLWLDGRLKVCESSVDPRETAHLKKLQDMELMELSEDESPLAAYRLLSRCIIVPAKLKPIHHSLSSEENRAWQWLSKAGLLLTIGELTKLVTDDIFPSPDLLGKENTQTLTMRLYASDLFFDTTLDLQMESSPERDKVVVAVLGLLRKKRIILT